MRVFYKYWKRLLVKRSLVKKLLFFQFCIESKKIGRAHHTSCKLEAYYILLHLGVYPGNFNFQFNFILRHVDVERALKIN